MAFRAAHVPDATAMDCHGAFDEGVSTSDFDLDMLVIWLSSVESCGELTPWCEKAKMNRDLMRSGPCRYPC
jgi:hypothetical protein